MGLIGVYESTMAQASGEPGRRGAELAVAELNAAGGVTIAGKTYRVRLIERQTANRADAAATTARALINLDSVDVIVGPQTSMLAIPAGAVAEASGVPMVSPMASSPVVTADRRLVTRLAMLDPLQGSVIARFAIDSLRVRRAAALHDAASTYGREITRRFDSTFRALGGQIVGIETFDADDPATHETQLRRLLAGRPDAILLPSFVVHDSAQIRVARALGFRGTFLGSDSWDVIPLLKRDDAVGSIVLANWDRRTNRDAARHFISAWSARYTENPRATGAASYDAVRLLAEAARRAGLRSGPPLMDSLRTLGAWEGALTSYRFVGTGDPVRGAVILEILRDSTRVRAYTLPDP